MRYMSTSFVVVVTALSACMTIEDTPDGCERDANACPASSRTASRVTCDCVCELPDIPVPGGTGQRFRGKVSACLPPALNPSIASDDEAKALDAMPDERFSQEVFRFCSREIADWLSLTVKSQIGRIAQAPEGLACSPYRCRCGTKGASLAYAPCERQCAERPCDNDSCMTLLRQGGAIHADSCLCNRTEACGFVTPPRGRPPLCRVLTPFEDDTD